MADRLAALARYGGRPVRATPMPPRLALGEAEEAMVGDVLRYYRERGLDPGYQGHFEQLYCQAFAETMGGGYADAVATGSAAVYLAIAALELPPGSEIIVSPITDPGSLNAVIQAGHRPRLADSKPDSFNIGVEQFTARISPKTRAVLVVHAAGQAAEIDAIAAEAQARDIRVIEDCSQAHLARLDGRPVGTFGDIAAFSTMYRKASITGASGGVVYTRDLDLHRRALAYADRGKTPWIEGFDDKDPEQFLFPALNYHTDEISCAIGLASWRRLPVTIATRMAFVKGLDLLAETSALCRPYGWTEGDSPFYYPIVVDPRRLPVSKTEFALAVAAEGIGLNPHYKYLAADWRYLRPYLVDDFEPAAARSIRDRCFTLFLNEKYGAQEIEDTIAAIRKVEDAFLS
jgi:dTDP-4-amino-4,6-dideoxygalactose transaminase